MLNRRNWVVSILALLLVASLAGCMAAPVAVPDRDVPISVDTALAAQAKLTDLMMGHVEWSEAEFSSLLSVLLQQNSGENNPVKEVQVWFDPGNKIVARVTLKDGVLPSGNTLDLAGTVSVEDMHVKVNLDSAGVGNMSVGPAVLAPVSAEINRALADPSMGVAVNVTTDTGVISVGLGGM